MEKCLHNLTVWVRNSIFSVKK